MTATTLRAITALCALTLLAAGCSIGRGRAPEGAARGQAKASGIASDVESLRKENAQLRDQQAAMQNRMQDLQHTLAQTQEEQRRYRESMTKNFDLLEQSVSLTLSKTITADLGNRPALSAAPAQPQARPTRPTPTAHASTAPAVSKAHAATASASAKASQPAAAARTTSMAMPTAAQPTPAVMRANPNAVEATPVAMRSPATAQEAAAEDPDLLPPQNPRHLTAHQEAKPLYEKGFDLFARKDYDQSIIVFKNFLQRFPDDIYSDNAQFWIAEAYRAEKRPAEAEAAYRDVLRDYEHRSTLEGYKTPDAIYRLGQLYAQRGDQRRARLFFGVLAERFPDTSAGRKASREMDAIGMNTAAR
ncbi:MAG TPA: tetratricopeptide repeat protein [bacterium]|nr:tetratricopeptide repeat protein [bacterium]